MPDLKPLLELRTKIKDKKPHFIRQDYQRRKRLGRKLRWKKPKGIHSKIRHKFKGHRKMPSPGWKSPREVSGLHATGLRITGVSSLEQLNKINKEKEGIVISKAVGIKKKYEILKKAKELNITVLNLNVDEQIKKIEDFISSKKKADMGAKKEESKEKKKVKKEIKEVGGDAKIQLLDAQPASGEETKEKSSEKLSERLSDEQKKEAEKRKKDKVLTKKA